MIKLKTNKQNVIKPRHDVVRQGTSKDTVHPISAGRPLRGMQPALKGSLFPLFSGTVLNSSRDRNMGQSLGLGY